MFHEHLLIPSSGGAQIALDAYVGARSCEMRFDRRRPAIVICPGGGYRFCSEREAEPVALHFLAQGFNTFVVWYRVAPNRFPVPQQDAAAAIAHVRAHAGEYNIDPDRIAIMGFSAGGHLAGSMGVLWHRAELWQEMGLTPEAVRPNALVLSYPVITAGPDAHRGSFENLTGSKDVADHQAYSLETLVTENCPPAFLWHTFDDRSVPVNNSLLMAQAMARVGVTAELHIYPHGTHGSSLCTALTDVSIENPIHTIPEAQVWPNEAARFLKAIM